MNSHTLNEAKKRLEPIRTDCAFCSKDKHSTNMEDNHFAAVYSIKDRTNLVVYRNVKFNEIKIGIPRCAQCKSIHSFAKIVENIVIVFAVLSIFIIPITLSMWLGGSKIMLIIYMAATFGLFVLFAKFLDKYIHSRYNILTTKEGSKREELIKEFLKQGWSLERPLA